jgi:putative transposase
LEQRISVWEDRGISLNYYDQANELKDVKKVEGYKWIKSVPAQALQQTLKDLEKSFKKFFNSGFGFPKFKKKGQGDSFRLPDAKQFEVARIAKKRGVVDLPKIGKVFFRQSRNIDGKIKNATIKKEADGWYISFCVEKLVEIQTNDNPSVGIDRGIAQTIALSDESKVNPSELRLPVTCNQLRKKIKALQKRLKNKKKFSESWKKIQKRISSLHARIARIRKDFLHKISSKLAKNHDQVTLEDLKIKNMSKSARGTVEDPGRNVKAKSGLNREILFQGWGLFAEMLRYKCHWNGSVFTLVKTHMTSRRCSECLFECKENRRGKVFLFLNCGHKEDADTNASKNINRAGLARRACGDMAVGLIDEARTSNLVLC